jgi:hypothetical protein
MDSGGMNVIQRLESFDDALCWAEELLDARETTDSVLTSVAPEDIEQVVKALNILLSPRAVFNHSAGCIYPIYLHVIPEHKKSI